MLYCFLCAVSSNLDTLSVCTSYGMKNIKISKNAILVLTLISSIGTFLSMKFGALILRYTDANFVNRIGSIALICMGIYFLYECTIKKDITKTVLLNDPVLVDEDKSGTIDFKEAFTLATVLTINNLGVGIAGGIIGLNIFYTTYFTFLSTLIAVDLGLYIGERFSTKSFGKVTQIMSSILIIIIGLSKIIFG